MKSRDHSHMLYDLTVPSSGTSQVGAVSHARLILLLFQRDKVVLNVDGE